MTQRREKIKGVRQGRKEKETWAEEGKGRTSDTESKGRREKFSRKKRKGKGVS